MVEAPVLFALCGKLKSSGYYKDKVSTKLGDWFMFDLGLATQTICLVAQSFGLGTVIVGYFDHDRAREVLEVPAGYEIVAFIPMGYPAKISSAPKRREVGEFTHHNTF
jgi:nitroreductase